MRQLLLLPLVVAFAQGDTLFFQPHENQVSGVACPDGKTYCPDGNTCCARETGEFACCPLSSAVCCSDKIHCCPMGYTCNVTTTQCQKGEIIRSWTPSQVSVKKASLISGSVICPDGQHECKEGQTCCKLPSGQWGGCCPLPKAVCCSDGKHCCPENTKCEVSSGKCMRGDGLVLDWFDKVPVQKRLPAATSAKKDNSVQCPDQKTSCPDKNTCCKNKEGNYGCCAYDNAVCCKSGTYCCPKGYICDTLPEICRMPEAKEAWKNTANRFIQRILRKKVAGQP